jgi:hypothetical protein
MSGWLTFWIILVGLGAPLYLYEAFVRPSQQLSHVPPVWRAVPLVMMTTITVVLALSPLGWQSFIVQVGLLFAECAHLLLAEVHPDQATGAQHPGPEQERLTSRRSPAVNAYLAKLPADKRAALQRLRKTIHSVLPRRKRPSAMAFRRSGSMAASWFGLRQHRNTARSSLAVPCKTSRTS